MVSEFWRAYLEPGERLTWASSFKTLERAHPRWRLMNYLSHCAMIGLVPAAIALWYGELGRTWGIFAIGVTVSFFVNFLFDGAKYRNFAITNKAVHFATTGGFHEVFSFDAALVLKCSRGRFRGILDQPASVVVIRDEGKPRSRRIVIEVAQSELDAVLSFLADRKLEVS